MHPSAMHQNLNPYLDKLAQGQINPCRSTLQIHGRVLEPEDADTPISLLDMHRWDLTPEQRIPLTTRDREFVLVPQFGAFTIQVDGGTIQLERPNGPFDLYPGGGSNASALYLPIRCQAQISGEGELVAFSCPADRPGLPRLITTPETGSCSIGAAFWRHDRTDILLPGPISQNLTLRELYLPAGHWADLPPATHDQVAYEETEQGEALVETNHEAIQYHRCRMAGPEIDPFVFATQNIMLGERLRRSYLVHDGDAVAIPGGAYPTAACPFTDHIVIRAMATPIGEPPVPIARDLEIYDFLRLMEPFILGVNDPSLKPQVSRANLRAFCKLHDFGDLEASVLVGTLIEQGFDIVGG